MTLASELHVILNSLDVIWGLVLVFGSDLTTFKDWWDWLGPLRQDFLRREQGAEFYRDPSIPIGRVSRVKSREVDLDRLEAPAVNSCMCYAESIHHSQDLGHLSQLTHSIFLSSDRFLLRTNALHIVTATRGSLVAFRDQDGENSKIQESWEGSSDSVSLRMLQSRSKRGFEP